jgi:hypothetical protein
MIALRWHRPLMLLAMTMAILVLVSLGGMIVDDRVLTGIPIWAKAAKFALSVLIYAVTWAWLIAQLTRWHRVAWWAGTVAAAGLGIELVVIVTQIVRGTTSHFNFTTPLNSALWETMGLSIIVVWVATLIGFPRVVSQPGTRSGPQCRDPVRRCPVPDRRGAGAADGAADPGPAHDRQRHSWCAHRRPCGRRRGSADPRLEHRRW